MGTYFSRACAEPAISSSSMCKVPLKSMSTALIRAAHIPKPVRCYLITDVT